MSRHTRPPLTHTLPMVLLLLRWAEYLRRGLNLGIPPVSLRIAPLPGCYGQFNGGRNEFRIPDEITIAEDGLSRPFRWVLSTVVHELLHHWRKRQGPGWCGHDELYRAKALACGLVVNEQGVTESLVPGGLFLTLLKGGGIQ